MYNIYMEVQWGYCDIYHSRIDEVIAMLEKHNAEKYLVGMEICTGGQHQQTKGEHMHFILHINPQDFKNLREKMRRTFNLGGKNNKQNKPYYGWMQKDIRDIDKLRAYTVKDKNIRSKGYTDEELEQLIESSFPKNPERNIFKDCIEALKTYEEWIDFDYDENHIFHGKTLDFQKLEIFILKFHMEQGVKVCKSKIKNIAHTYLQLEYGTRYEDLKDIYYYIMK